MAAPDWLQDDDLPVERVALGIAQDHDPTLDAPGLLARLDQLAAPIPRSEDPRAALEALLRHAYETLDLHASDDYDDPRSSLLPSVIELRRGTPTALAVVLIALGRRAGVRLEPIAFPGHFLVRSAQPSGDVFIDPSDGGHPIPRAALIQLAQTDAGDDAAQAERRLEPVGARATAVRLLVNLQRAHQRRGDHARALLVCDRLFDATGAVLHRCDRGAHALALGAARAAVADFEAYLAARPTAPDAQLVHAVLERARAFAARPAN